MLYPLILQPIFKERVWGGRQLAALYRKPLPPDRPIGESWEISDRPEGVSVIANGPLAGRDLRWLMTHHGAELLGSAKALNGRFPLLAKILDAREKLSLQVHPPAEVAARLNGEPKSELWYITQTKRDAELLVGLKRGVSREEFERKLKNGTVADCFHRVRVRPGDAMFLPSGRVHAIGGGIVLLEIQQNSDTTYRVFDWNRPGLDGKPRALHIAESLASIDFNDFEPALVHGETNTSGGVRTTALARQAVFKVDLVELSPGGRIELRPWRCVIVAVTSGRLKVTSRQGEVLVGPGQFCLIPGTAENVWLAADSPVCLLQSEPG